MKLSLTGAMNKAKWKRKRRERWTQGADICEYRKGRVSGKGETSSKEHPAREVH